MIISKATRTPGIPAVSGIGDPAIRKLLDAMKELLEVREGVRGDPLDRAVTLRDLLAGGVAGVTIDGQTILPGEYNPGTAGPVRPPLDYTIPPAITGFQVAAAVTTVVLYWDLPNYANYAHAEIWRASVDDLGQAVKIGTSPGGMYADAQGTSASTHYYWVRAVSRASISGPYNAGAGTPGTTGAVGPGVLESAFIDKLVAAQGKLVFAQIQQGDIFDLTVGNEIKSSNYAAGLAGWRIANDGSLEANNGTFRGTLDVKSAASGARLEMKNNVIKVFDAGGVLRVRLGDLSA